MEKQINVVMKRMNYLTNEIDGAYQEAALELRVC